MSEWPNQSWIIFMGTLFDNSNEATLCLRS